MRFKRLMVIGAVLGLAACGTEDESFRLGYSFFVDGMSATDAGVTDSLGATVEVDVVQNNCSGDPLNPNFEAFTNAEAVATLIVTRRGASLDEDGALVDEASDLDMGLEIRVMQVWIEFTPIEPASFDSQVVVPIEGYVLDGNGAPLLTLDASGGDVSRDMALPLLPIRRKIEYNRRAEELFGSILDQFNANEGPYSYGKYRVRYTFYAVDNYGRNTDASYEGFIDIGDWNRC